MNFPKEYIKQCEKAEKIQKHKIQVGDYYAYLRPKRDHSWSQSKPIIEIIREDDFSRPIHFFSKKEIENCWLPLPHQLLNMIEKIKNRNMSPHANLCYIINKTKEDLIYYKMFDSMVEFLLAVFMWQKFSKKWTGTRWVEKSRRLK